MKIKIFLIFILALFMMGPTTISFTDEKDMIKKNNKPTLDKENNLGVNFYTGMFDFSDDGKKSQLFGFEHQNQNLYRETKIGTFSPVTGYMLTADGAMYLYTGIETDYDLGRFQITPSFTPGFYSKGDGKDLGHILEFKSEVQVSMDLGESTNFGLSYNHISNASLGDKNPGANSYMFNFLKKF